MRPAVATLIRSRIATIGVTLTTAAALLFLVLVTLDFLGFIENPYAGIVVFIMVPAIFVAGLLLIPIGLWLDRRRRMKAGAEEPLPATFSLADPNLRRAVFFVAIAVT